MTSFFGKKRANSHLENACFCKLAEQAYENMFLIGAALISESSQLSSDDKLLDGSESDTHIREKQKPIDSIALPPDHRASPCAWPSQA